MFASFEGHGQRFVGEFVALGLLGVHLEGLGAREVLAVNDGAQVPVHVGAVCHHQVTGLLLSHVSREVQHVPDGRHHGTHAG